LHQSDKPDCYRYRIGSGFNLFYFLVFFHYCV
jgi:hypothetical protein